MVVESDTLNRHSMTLADITFLNATEDHNKQSEDDPVTVRQEFDFFPRTPCSIHSGSVAYEGTGKCSQPAEFFDGLHPIVMYTVCDSATDLDNMLFSVQFDVVFLIFMRFGGLVELPLHGFRQFHDPNGKIACPRFIVECVGADHLIG
mgnify:CR=1 FL=1